MFKQGENMKTYKSLIEAKPKKWSDIKDRNTKKEASQFLKALDVGQVLGYSVEHQEFSIFDDEKDFKKAQQGSKGKAMQWVKVEGWIRHGEAMNEAYKPSFNFKAAVKIGMLDKTDEKPILSMKKKGWEIYEFILTSKGFELTMKKGSEEKKFVDKRPDYVLQVADKKLKK